MKKERNKNNIPDNLYLAFGECFFFVVVWIDNLLLLFIAVSGKLLNE